MDRVANNEYESIVSDLSHDLNVNQIQPQQQQTPDPQPAIEYDNIVKEIFTEEREASKNALKTSSFVAANASPDQTAKAMKLAQKYNLPPSMIDMIERNTDILDREDKLNTLDLDKMVDNNPNTTEFLSNPNNAKLAMDDHGNLTITEDKFKEYGLLNEWYDRAYVGLANMYAGINRLPGTALELSLIPSNIVRKMVGADQVGIPKEWINTDNAKYWENLAKGVSNNFVELDGSIVNEVGKGDYSKAARLMLMQATESFPTSMLVGASMFAGMGPSVGAALAGGITAGQSLVETKDNPDVSPLAGQTTAFAKGSMEGLFEKLQILGPLKHWEQSLSKHYGKKITAEVFKDFGKAWAYSVGTEGSTELLTQYGQDLSDYITGVNPEGLSGIHQRALDAGLVGSFMGGTTTGLQSFGLAHKRSQQLRESALARDFYLSLGEDTKNSKLRERLPEAYKEHVDGITKKGPVQNIYIEPEDFKTYAQENNFNPIKVAQELGIVDEFTKSEENGTPITVPLSKWAIQAVDTEHFKGLVNDVRLREDALSPNEAKKLNASLQEDLAKEAESAKAIEDSQPQTIKEAKEISKKLEAELLDSGKFTKQQVRDMGAIYESFFKTYVGDRQGISPKEFFANKPLTITNALGEVDLTNGDHSKVEIEPEIKVLNQNQLPIVQTGKNLSPLGFYSQVESEVSKMDFKEMPAQDLFNRIKNIPGVKATELNAFGLQEWINQKPGKITKDDVLNFIKEKTPIVDQTVLGAGNAEDGFDFSEPTFIPMSEADRHGFNDAVSSEMDYYLEDDKEWIEENTAEIRAEIISRYTDKDGNIDEDGLKSKIESELQVRAEERAEEYVNSEDYHGAVYEIEERNSGYKLTGSDEYGWYSDYLREHFDGNAEEAKIKFAQKLIEEGIIEAKTSDLLTADKVEFRAPSGIQPSDATIKKKAKALFEKDKDRLIKKAVEDEYSWQFDDYEGTPEELKKDKEKYGLKVAIEEVEKSYDDPANPRNKITINVATSLFDAKLVGNNKNGYTLELRKEAGTRAKSLKEYKLEGKTPEDAQKSAVEKLLKLGLISKARNKTEVNAVNQPSGKTKWASHTVPGGENYREILIQLPENPGDKFTYRTHFNEANILAHVRTTDRTDAQGRKVLYLEEVQSDWNQQGREKGFRTEEAKKAQDEFENYSKELAEKYDLNPLQNLAMFGTIKGMEKDEIEKYEFLQSEWLKHGKEAVPDNPFKQTESWSAVAMKRMLKYAQEMGYDALAWTPGSVHVERWGTDSVSWVKKNEGENLVVSHDPAGSRYTILTKDQIHGRPVAGGIFPYGDLTELNGQTVPQELALKAAQDFADRRNVPGWLVGSVEQVGGNADGMNIEEIARQRGQLLERKGEFISTKEELKEVIVSTLRRERTDRSLESLTDQLWKKMQTEESGVKAPRKEGMEFFYDNVLPKKVAPEVLKKLDKEAKVIVNNIETSDEPVKSWEIVLTDKMKDALIEGQSLFQSKPTEVEQVEFALPEFVQTTIGNGDSISPKTKRSQFSGTLKKLIKKGQYVNIHTGITINISTDTVKKADATARSIKTDTYAAQQIEVAQYLPDLLKNAVYLTSNNENKDRENKGWKYLFAPLDLNGSEHFVKLSVKETKDGHTLHAYSVVKNSTGEPGNQAASSYSTKLAVTPNGVVPIAQFLGNVNAIREKFKFFQGEENGPRAEIRIGAHSMDMRLFEKADPTSPIHEFAHASLEWMGDIAESQAAKGKSNPDYDIILKALGVTSREEIKTEHHEKFASWLEAYFLEGKAPSERLRSVFHRLKNLFRSIYQYIVGQPAIVNGIQVSPEIKDVFDRMLATDEEIQRNMPKPMFPDPASLGMSSSLTERYMKAQQEAQTYAEDILRADMMKDLKKQEREDYRQLKESSSKGWTKTANEMPVYKVLAVLQTDTMADGTEIPEGLKGAKLDRTALVQLFGEDIVKAIPKGIVAENGIHPQILSELFEFKSVTQMVDQISTARPKQEFIDSKVKEVLDQTFPDRFKNMIPDDALKAIYNERLAEMKQIELEHLATNNLGTLKNIIKRVTARPPEKTYIKENANQIISGIKVGELNPRSYYLAERRAAKNAGEALAKGDIQAAFEWKRKEQLNSFLYKAAIEEKTNIEDFSTEVKRFMKKDSDLSGKRDLDLIGAGRKILAHYNLVTLKEAKSDPLSLLKEYDRDGYEHAQALVDGAMVIGKNDFKQLTFGEFQDMRRNLDALWKQSRNEMLIEIGDQKFKRSSVIGELQDRITEISEKASEEPIRNRVSKFDRISSAVMSSIAHGTRVEAWVNAMDKEFNGVFRKYIWNPINDSVTKYRNAKQESFNKLENQILKKYSHLFDKKIEIYAKEIGYTFKSNSELIGAILHSGNLSNMDKLVRGNRWGTFDESTGETDMSKWQDFMRRAMKDGTITKDHMDLAQAIWDLMDSFKAGTQKAHKDIYGHYFDEITANPIQTPWGIYNGGYIPAIADPFLNKDVELRRAKNELEDTSYANAFPSTGRGATMKRVQAYAAPLSLDLNFLGAHIDWALRFTYIQPAVKQISKIVMNRDFKNSMATLNDHIITKTLIPWLQRTATQKVMAPGRFREVDTVAKFLRSSASLQIMFGNFANGLQQLTGTIVGMSKIPIKYVVKAVVTQSMNPFKVNTEINEMSPWMRVTVNSNVYETQTAIKELLVDKDLFTNLKRTREAIKKHGYIFGKLFQGFTSNVVWLGAFNEHLENGHSKDEAIKYADSAVRLTQGSATPENISAFEMGTPSELLFKQFISYFNMLANLGSSEATRILRDTHTPNKIPQLVYLYTTALAIPAIVSHAIITSVGKGYSSDDEDELDAQLLDTFFWSQVKTLTAMLPYGQALNTLINGFNNNNYDDRLSMSPGLQMTELAFRTPGILFRNQTEDRELTEKELSDIATGLGFIAGYPIGPIWKRGRAVYKTMDEDNNSDPIDFTRGVLVGKARKE